MTTRNLTARAPAEPMFHPDSADPRLCDLSVIVPLHNEEENVVALYRELHEVLEASGQDYEIIFIDDGSTDQTLDRLSGAVAGDGRVLIVELRRNFGQTCAMAAGFDLARGRVIIPMDGDLQNDPHDIPQMLAKLNEPPGYDVVSGWRKDRQDRMLTRRIPSQIANRLIGWVTGVSIHDYGCTMKAYRREVIENVALYSELHRFIPALASWEGARITELEVNHRPRIAGRTKYGLKRTFRVLLDLVTVKFMGSYRTKPLYFFGKLAVWTLFLSLAVFAIAVLQRFGYLGQPDRLHLNRNVLVLVSAVLSVFGVQCILTGILAEMLVRVYHESQGRPIYRVRRVLRASDLIGPACSPAPSAGCRGLDPAAGDR